MPRRLPRDAELFPEVVEQAALFDDIPAAGEYPLPAGAEPARCRSCNEPIVWTNTEAGKAIPLTVRTRRLIGNVPYAKTHFSDCPHSRQWRKR